MRLSPNISSLYQRPEASASVKRTRVKWHTNPTVFVVLLICLAIISRTASAQDASIDKLLNKLPPPEKLVKPRVQQAVHRSDNALKDPVTQQILDANGAGNYRTALALSRQLVQRNPDSPSAHFLRGAFALDTGQYAEAAGAFRSSVAIQSNVPISHLALGVAEMCQKHFAAAITPLEQSERLEPSWAIGWMLASECATRLGRREQGVDYARRGTAAEPSWVLSWIQLARAEKASNHNEAMLNAITKAAEVEPDNSEIFAAIGFSYININKFAQAIPPLQRAVHLSSGDYLINAQLGFCLQSVGQVDQGITYLRKTVSLNSAYGPAWEHLGLAYQKKGDHPEAVKSFERATQLLPAAALPWQHLEQEYRSMGRTADAEQAAKRAQQLGHAPHSDRGKKG